MLNKDNKYYIDVKEKEYFISCLLMELFVNHKKTFPLVLFGDNEYLDDYLLHMANQEWIKVNELEFEPTQKGIELLKNHKAKLIEFRSLYKLYSAVDTGEGIFGYSSYFDFDTDEEFYDYIKQDNFEDLRVALCEFKGMNPLEVIFLEMIDENRFDLESDGWQFELTSGLIWDEMVEIANTNIRLENLAEEGINGTGAYTGEQVMEIIITEGTEVLKTLIAYEEGIDNEEVDDEEVIEETSEYVEEPYYNNEYYTTTYYNSGPYYHSPIWGVRYY